jgi:hypothetical protein
MNKNLTDLLKKKQKQATKEEVINWDERRDKYLAKIDQLYKQIESIFSEAIRDKTIHLSRRKKELSENYIGTYAVDDLVLLIGDEQVRFSPRGRNIVGAEGRVDLVGERGEAVLIAQADSGWAIVQSRQPKLHTAPFNESTLAEVLQLVMRDR